MKTAISEMRSTEDNPALRRGILLELGGHVFAAASTIGNELLVDVDQSVRENGVTPHGDTLGDKAVDKMAAMGTGAAVKATRYGARAGRYAKKLRGYLAKEYKKENRHGKDRDGEDMVPLIVNLIAAADEAYAELEDQGADTERKANLLRLREELQDELDAWRAEAEQKQVSGEVELRASAAAVPLLNKALELAHELAPGD
jgi:hypothetical protein